MNLPRKLELGDTIGILSTSSPTTTENMDRLTAYFNHRGYKVKLSENCLNNFGFLVDRAEVLAQDFNFMIADPEIKAILTATGGTGAIHLLPLIDYDLFKNNPKIFCGLSDPSILLNTITLKTGIPTFHGPNGYTFGYTNPTNFTEDNWWKLVTGNILSPYEYQTTGMHIIKSGKLAIGQIFGGNDTRLKCLLGTKWLQFPKNFILFIEAVNYLPSILDDLLANLKIHGVFDIINGLIIGRFADYTYNNWWGNDIETFEAIVLRNCQNYDFPIVANLLIGHTEDKMTLPIGAKFELDTEKCKLTLLEQVVV